MLKYAKNLQFYIYREKQLVAIMLPLKLLGKLPDREPGPAIGMY
jgi:hypothetical protein